MRAGTGIALAAGPGLARADLTHIAQVLYTPATGADVAVVDSLRSPGSVPPSREVRSMIQRTESPGYRVEAATGPPGDFGSTGQIFSSGRVDAINVIEYKNDQLIRNLSATEQLARGGFLIEGGMAEVGPDSRVQFEANFTFQIFDATSTMVASPTYREGFLLARGSTGGANLSTIGADNLGATLVNTRRVTIPLSFHEFDVGVVPPLGHVEFTFRFDAIGFLMPTGDASATWTYADPLSIDGIGPNPTTTVTFSPVPEPTALGIAAAATAAGGAVRRARRR